MIDFINEEGMISPVGGDLSATTAVFAFSTFLFDELIAKLDAKPLTVLPGGIELPVYVAERNGTRILAYHSPIGAPSAVAAMEELIAKGVKNFVAFGICGALVPVSVRSFIVPDRAFRDEGTSYHYMPASEYVDVPGAKYVKEKLTELGLSTAVGGTWTTDGFYRETPTRKNQMLNKGCIAVDMECSALQAAANFRGASFYTFFISADSLAGEEWEPNDILELKVSSADKAAVAAAVEIAYSLA